jgi:hypothetical protein
MDEFGLRGLRRRYLGIENNIEVLARKSGAAARAA